MRVFRPCSKRILSPFTLRLFSKTGVSSILYDNLEVRSVPQHSAILLKGQSQVLMKFKKSNRIVFRSLMPSVNPILKITDEGATVQQCIYKSVGFRHQFFAPLQHL